MGAVGPPLPVFFSLVISSQETFIQNKINPPRKYHKKTPSNTQRLKKERNKQSELYLTFELIKVQRNKITDATSADEKFFNDFKHDVQHALVISTDRQPEQ